MRQKLGMIPLGRLKSKWVGEIDLDVLTLDWLKNGAADRMISRL